MKLVSKGRVARVIHVASVAACVTALGVASLTNPVLALEPAARFVDIQPESAEVDQGTTVSLTARVYSEPGLLYAGPGTSTHVRFFFVAGSPNDIDSPGNSPDLQCTTGTAGECSVSYDADELGSDLVCVMIAGPVSQCDEPVNDPDLDDRVDVVERLVVSDSWPTPSPVTEPVAVARSNAGSNAGSDTGSNAGSDPRSDTGSDPRSDPRSHPGSHA